MITAAIPDPDHQPESAGDRREHVVGRTVHMRGLRATPHVFEVPLDHVSPVSDGSPRINVFAREYSSLDHSAAEVADLPWLLFLQGGPGGRGVRTTQLNGWLKAAARQFRILMLDQRGTGFSTPADAATLEGFPGAAAQAAYLAHFRADSIVADAEIIRQRLGSGPWTVFGQSYGGFCTLTYLSFAPQGIARALITGGLPPLSGGIDQVYRATYARVEERNAEYFGWYPEDRDAVARISRHLREVPEHLPGGERLTPRRFQMVGSYLGGTTRVHALHFLLEDAFTATPRGPRLSATFLEQVQATVGRGAHPLYAVLHESIYCHGEASRWSAQRVLDEYPQFRDDAEAPLLTGEMVYPWYFDEDPALQPLDEVAHLLASKDDWGPLYDADVLATNTVPVAAAVYRDDIYVDRGLSLRTAGAVRNLRVWETADFHHDGIADDGAAIFDRLLGMTDSTS